MNECETCNNSGEVEVTHYWDWQGNEQELVGVAFIMCPTCSGKGKEEGEKRA